MNLCVCFSRSRLRKKLERTTHLLSLLIPLLNLVPSFLWHIPFIDLLSISSLIYSSFNLPALPPTFETPFAPYAALPFFCGSKNILHRTIHPTFCTTSWRYDPFFVKRWLSSFFAWQRVRKGHYRQPIVGCLPIKKSTMNGYVQRKTRLLLCSTFDSAASPRQRRIHSLFPASLLFLVLSKKIDRSLSSYI